MADPDQTRFARCKFAIGDVLTDIMRQYMKYTNIPTKTIYQSIMNDKEFKNKLSQEEIKIIQNLELRGFDDFDISLMYKIARHKTFGMIVPEKPTRGWKSNPIETENTPGDNIQRIKICRNEVCHNPNTAVSEDEFETMFKRYVDIGRRAIVHLKENDQIIRRIENYMTCSLDNEMEEKYKQQIETLTKLVEIQTKTGNSVKIFASKETQTKLDILRTRESFEDSSAVKITMFGIKDVAEQVEQINRRKPELRTDSISVINAIIGSLVINLMIQNALFENDQNIQNGLTQFVRSLFLKTDMTCDQCNIILEIEDDDVSDEDTDSEDDLVLHIEVKNDAFTNCESISQNFDEFISNLVTEIDGTVVLFDRDVTAELDIEKNGIENGKKHVSNSMGSNKGQISTDTDYKNEQYLSTDFIQAPKHCSTDITQAQKHLSTDIIQAPMRTTQIKDAPTEALIEEMDGLTLQGTICAPLRKPYSMDVKSDRIVLQWRVNNALPQNQFYQVKFREHPNGKWKYYDSNESWKEDMVTIEGLKAKKSYVFKVRIVDEDTEYEGPFSEESDPINTVSSPAQGVLDDAIPIKQGHPSIYRLPIKEDMEARNQWSMTRKYYLGEQGSNPAERTIMIVGATGSGKSTLINAIANYILGVTWEDCFRFLLVDEKEGDQACSQTEGISCYTLYNACTDRIDYTLNIIDTPGFGDTRGLEHDEKIVNQLRELFLADDRRGVSTIDAVCFILKAPDARLSITQRYIYESILSLFGKDIINNICSLITFADGEQPPVLAALRAIDGIPLPYKTYFKFNNSALFADNTQNVQNNLSLIFWNMGIQSCETFFNHLTTLKTRSLQLTSEVLIKRQALEVSIISLHSKVDVGLTQITNLQNEVNILKENTEAILANKDFEYKVDEEYQEKVDLKGKGQHTTNCLNCNFTCHENCAFANDNDKARCVAMNQSGQCMNCPECCHWTQHHNLPYIIKWSTRKITKRYDEMKMKYEDATKRTLNQEQVIDYMNKEISYKEQEIKKLMETISTLNNILKVIALRPDPLSTAQYIDLLIASEKREKRRGFEARVETLEKCKSRAKYGESVKIFEDRVRVTRENLTMTDDNIAELMPVSLRKELWKKVKRRIYFIPSMTSSIFPGKEIRTAAKPDSFSDHE